MTKPTTPPSPFNTSGPSLTLPKMGRIKSDHQRQQDATRVNGYSDSGRSTGPTNSSMAPR